ncbi:TPA: hypothetical protein G8W46_000320 [Salmonella enterica]|uniref:Uncharacterized protein n=1 Tax=Salmonella enterica TaxID=28901 RepID=A0A759RUB0_SALER|nr:hypothetical protein [Salmonella enterica subsp. enterica serovar Vitkin]EBX1725489.1 hypothetical protein [Salmonella enterica subsp. enterica serovar Richmond]ECA1910640.1 hypothetical protein [Salmonella enterica subsp. enterica serovar Vitkin]EFS9261285.1 hypothetical protein [Salmonella enterica]HAG1980901.1 hypothetical protein [Salmonella enterica]
MSVLLKALTGQLVAEPVAFIALMVSSVALLMCEAMHQVPDVALGLYLGAWVTHAGVQSHQQKKAALLMQGIPGNGNESEPH